MRLQSQPILLVWTKVNRWIEKRTASGNLSKYAHMQV